MNNIVTTSAKYLSKTPGPFSTNSNVHTATKFVLQTVG